MQKVYAASLDKQARRSEGRLFHVVGKTIECPVHKGPTSPSRDEEEQFLWAAKPVH